MRVALDFDGTLCDSMGALEDLASEVVRGAFAHVPGHLVRSSYRTTAGMPFEQQVTYLPIPRRAQKVAALEFAERKVAVTLACEPFPDVRPTLEAWAAAGVDLVVVSSTTSDLLRLWLRRHGLVDLVSQVYGLSFGTKLEQLQRSRPRWFVGDTRWDAVKAAEAGCSFLGVQRDGRLLSERDSAARDLTELTTHVLVGGAVTRFLDDHQLAGPTFLDPEEDR